MRRFAGILAALGLLTALSSGCSSAAMKGTPFFTGEYEKAEGKPEDRVNLWPLLYYRDPALSILWPIGEVTDEHVAVRPLFAVNKLDKEHPEVRILWPLCELDFDSGDYWALPFIWGKDRFIVLPLYWQDKDSEVLFPVFWHEKDKHLAVFPLFIRTDDDFHLLWPIFRNKTGGDNQGWHVWPLYGQYEGDPFGVCLVMSVRDGDKRERCVLPLYFGERAPGHSWDLLLPLFYYGRNDAGSHTWLSPLYMRERMPGRAWDLVPPLFYYGRDDAGSRTWLSPLYMGGRTPDKAWDLVPPLFYRDRDNAGNRTWLSPLYMGQRTPDMTWDLVPPFYLRHVGPDSRTTVITPWLHTERGDKQTRVLFPFYWDFRDSDSWLKLLLPVYGGLKSGEDAMTLLFPFYCRYKSGKDSMVLTLLGGTKQTGPKKTTFALPLLSAYTSSPDGKDLWALFPLGRWQWKDGLKRSHFLPFYYYDHSGAQKTLVMPPLLSAYTSSPDGKDLWAPFPLGRWQWKNGLARSHVLPFYYWDREAGLFLSPIASRHSDAEGGFFNLLGPLVHHWWRADSEGWWFPFPIAGSSTTPERAAHHLWPLYYWQRYDNGRQLDLGPLAVGYLPKRPDEKWSGWSFLPLMSYKRIVDKVSLYALLFGLESGKDRLAHGLWPVYWYQRHAEGRSLHWGPFIPGGGARHPTPALSLAGSTRDDTQSSSWLFPLVTGRSTRTSTWYTPDNSRYGMEVKRRWSTLFPLIWHQRTDPQLDTLAKIAGPSGKKVIRGVHRRPPQAQSSLTVLPLFTYARKGTFGGEQKAPAERSFRLLGWLYDHKKEARVSDDADGRPSVYVRSRVLWRVMHHERVDDYSTLDIFPGITYDHKPGEKKTFSFLWRFVRYEWDKEKGSKRHFLFIPF